MKPLLALFLFLPLSAATAQLPLASEGKSVEHWTGQLKSAEFRDQWYAAYVLGTLGPKAAPAVPALHKVIADVNAANEYSNNEIARSMAAWALGRIGAAAEGEIPFLMETMRSTELLAVRRSTAEALGNFGPAAKPAVAKLLKLLDSDDEITSVNAAVALWKIERHPKALPALLEMLRHGTSASAYFVAVALGRISADADAVAPALIEALHAHPGDAGWADVRRAAARSLGELGKAAFPALRKAKALQDPNAEVRRLVIETVSWMGPAGVSPLKAALEDAEPDVRRAAARALGNLGAEARAARAALVTAASDPKSEDVRTAADKALRLIPAE